MLAREWWHDELDIYVEYPRPEFSVYIEDVEYLTCEYGYHVFNVTLRLEGIGMTAQYSFDEFGRKEQLSESFVPVYLLAISPFHEGVWIVERLNETHYLAAIPTGLGPALRYHFGGGFEDVWKEPWHEYLGSYAPPGKRVWLRVEVPGYYISSDTAAFTTPWGQVVEVKLPIKP